MANSRMKVVVLSLSFETNLFNHVERFLAQRRLQDSIELIRIYPPPINDNDQSPQMQGTTEWITDGLNGADALLAAYSALNVAGYDTMAPFLCTSQQCSLKYLQFNFAGCEEFLKSLDHLKLPPPSYPVCRFGGYIKTHMAEFVVGNIIARERNLPYALERQKEHKWDRDFLCEYRRLNTLTIGIIGVGDIGKEVARACKFFGMTVWGTTRSGVTDKTASPHVDHYRQFGQLDEMMESCDYICAILPSTPDTRGLLTADSFKSCSNKKSVLISVGRGDITTDDAIAAAIKNEWLGGAILDVQEQEPLPKDSPLWDLPRVVIFPHVAACNHDDEVAEMFVGQLERLLNKEPLLYEIDFKKGY